MDEHEQILNRLIILEEALKRPLVEGPFLVVSEIIDFIKHYADEFHHAKEETVYFEWMRGKNPSLDQGPLHCMLNEHNQGREYIEQASHALEQVRQGATDKEQVVRNSLNHFIELLRNHIQKENEVLYKMAEQLDQTAQDGDKVMLPHFMRLQDEFSVVVNRYQ